MFKKWAVPVSVLILTCGVAAGQPQSPPRPPESQNKDETSTIEVFLSAEHLASNLKAGAKANLLIVLGKTVAPNGKVAYSTSTLAPGVEIASIAKVEKPKSPEQAIKVELRVAKDQAAKVERATSRLVNTVESTPGAQPERKQKPVTLRLEPVK